MMTQSRVLIWPDVDSINLVSGNIKEKNSCPDSDKARLIIINM